MPEAVCTTDQAPVPVGLLYKIVVFFNDDFFPQEEFGKILNRT